MWNKVGIWLRPAKDLLAMMSIKELPIDFGDYTLRGEVGDLIYVTEKAENCAGYCNGSFYTFPASWANIVDISRITRTCVAVFDQDNVEQDGLALRKGDIIDVIQEHPSKWWKGINGKKVGWFLSTLVETTKLYIQNATTEKKKEDNVSEAEKRLMLSEMQLKEEKEKRRKEAQQKEEELIRLKQQKEEISKQSDLLSSQNQGIDEAIKRKKIELDEKKRVFEEAKIMAEKIKKLVQRIGNGPTKKELIDGTNNFSKKTEMGSMEEVYLGIYRGVEVAIKIVNEDYDPTELQKLRSFSSPNIITLIDSCQEGKELFLIFELKKRGSLEYVLSEKPQRRNLTWNIRINIALDIVSGLEYIHANNIIHTNLSPFNVLLNEQMHACLSDFGFSKNTPGGKTIRTVRNVRNVSYISPEGGNGILSNEMDIYSLGLIMLRLATGKEIFNEIHIMDRCKDVMK
eukprot:TRINITY_DN11814_c0_g1_i4.p1 TRINITY_DN11814_c0_g1~~TRINITY_DN11814_c0_g1_i4.p1  ORF type:complete len:457 (-),score=156.52 TRINITY_DN11814_c0_g1_i4:29-1399(-)